MRGEYFVPSLKKNSFAKNKILNLQQIFFIFLLKHFVKTVNKKIKNDI